jgi:D-alanine-D-alanine ligase-like ATP-grasp enzyme
MRPFALPDEIARRCVEVTARLGLVLSGVDLRLGADGAWTCFEVNPMPAYSYFEAHTGLPIAAALGGLLTRAGDRDTAGIR